MTGADLDKILINLDPEFLKKDCEQFMKFVFDDEVSLSSNEVSKTNKSGSGLFGAGEAKITSSKKKKKPPRSSNYPDFIQLLKKKEQQLNRKELDNFIRELKQREGVTTHDDVLRLRDILENNGKSSPEVEKKLNQIQKN